MERTIDGFIGFISLLPDSEEKGIIYGTGAWKICDIENTPSMKEAYEMGKAR